VKFKVTESPRHDLLHLWAEVNLTFEIGRHHPGAEIKHADGMAVVGEIIGRTFHWFAWADRLTEEEKQAIREQTSKKNIDLMLVTQRLKQ